MNNEPAFPIIHPPVEGITCGGVEHYGLSLRDYFAAKALTSILGVLVAERRGDVDKVIKVAAETAYKMSDAMLEARK